MDGFDPEPGDAPLILGIGCRAGLLPTVAIQRVTEVLGKLGRRASKLATIDIRQREPAVLALAEAHSIPLECFCADALNAQTDRLTHRSARTFHRLGCWGVAEAAALAAAGPGARLVLVRTVWPDMTLAAAEAPV